VDQGIFVSSMDGSNRKLIVQSSSVGGIAVDFPAKRLFFTDLKSRSIETTTMNGKDRHVVIKFSEGIRNLRAN